MKRKPKILALQSDGSVRLPDEFLEYLELKPGEQVRVLLDPRRGEIRIERHVDDPWAEAMKKKPEKGFEDLIADQDKRRNEAEELFDKKLKDPPKVDPEDKKDLWR